MQFLINYVRISKPQQKEIEDWQKIYSMDLDRLSDWRLPYLPELFSTDVWKILKPEINLDTYKKWFEGAHVWNIDKNDICTYAIKGSIQFFCYSRLITSTRMERLCVRRILRYCVFKRLCVVKHRIKKRV